MTRHNKASNKNCTLLLHPHLHIHIVHTHISKELVKVTIQANALGFLG